MTKRRVTPQQMIKVGNKIQNLENKILELLEKYGEGIKQLKYRNQWLEFCEDHGFSSDHTTEDLLYYFNLRRK